LKSRGRTHSPVEKRLMKQVRDVFDRKRRDVGAKQAASQLNVSLASFYNYAAGKDLPRLEVLRDAQEKWGIKWELIDPSEILRTRKVSTAEQLAFAFLDAVRQEDVEITKIKPKGKSVLQILLQIRFSA
jgi:hypothetical protein